MPPQTGTSNGEKGVEDLRAVIRCFVPGEMVLSCRAFLP